MQNNAMVMLMQSDAVCNERALVIQNVSNEKVMIMQNA